MPRLFNRTDVADLSRNLRDYIRVGESSSIDPAKHTARISHREMKKKDPQISVAGIKKIPWYQQELLRKYLCTSTQETA